MSDAPKRNYGGDPRPVRGSYMKDVEPLKLRPIVLTKGEALQLAMRRGRLSAGKQSNYAKDWALRYGCKQVSVFNDFIKGRRIIPKDWVIPDPDKLTPGEHCWMLRMRSGLSGEACASEIGCDVTGFFEMEQGEYDPSRLYRYWESKDV